MASPEDEALANQLQQLTRQARYIHTLRDSDRPNNRVQGNLMTYGVLEEEGKLNLWEKVKGGIAKFNARHVQHWSDEQIGETITEGRNHVKRRNEVHNRIIGQ